MRKGIKNLINKPIVRNVVIMATGTAAAQALTMILSPIITRMYGPDAYGLMGVFMAIVGIVSPIAALTYPIAIVLPKSDNEARGLIRLSLYITVGITVAAAFILLLFNQSVIRLFGLEEVASFLYLIPLVILFSGLSQVIEQWLIRTEQFSITAKVTFYQVLMLQVSKVGIGIFNPVAAVLVTLSALGNGMKALMLILFTRRSDGGRLIIAKRHEKKIPIKELAKKHKDFPIYRAPQVLINAISQGLPVLLFSSFFGPAAAGFYAIGRSVLGIPAQLIGKSVGDVFYPRISEAANKGENLTRLIKKATLSLAAVGLIPFGAVFLFGPWLFSFVFGAEWIVAGEYARWVALWMFCMFINQPSIKALPVLSAQAFHLKFTIITLVIHTATLVIGYYVFSSDLIAIAIFGVSGAMLYIILILITLHISKKFDGRNKYKR